MRIVFIGCVDFSFNLLDKVLSLPEAEVVGIVTRPRSSFNSDFKSLQPLADRFGIPCFLDSGNQQSEIASWITSLSCDVIYCFGWPYLLCKEILELPRLGVIGYHPTALPKNRGRHPIIWTLVLGLNETASTFFFMDEGADSGDLLSQRYLTVARDDDACTLYQRLQVLALEQVAEFTPLLATGGFSRIPQKHEGANYWRKRNKEDGEVDWRMPANGIYNLVRALARPYPGAHVKLGDSEIKIWCCEVLRDERQYEGLDFEPGRVLAITDGGIDVKCGDGIVRLIEHEFETLPGLGDYL